MALHVGIDLGTTNSAAAVFDGEELQIVRGADGASLTPSVVRIDARGKATVGARARKYLDSDPENVRSEFKRLMGTPHRLGFAASGLEKTPAELSAEVLRTIREDVREQTGVLPERAVISVPALFELPQTSATSEAARLAGFAQVEMIQEPVASAIAAGFREGDSPLPWLVYDLGGGTFDVSLLETQEGLLRVVGHDGDNFLGGRDFDGAIVDWALLRIADAHGVRIERSNPAALVALRRLRAAAEDAKIALSRARDAELVVDRLVVGDRELDVALTLDRATLEALVQPLVDRSIEVCRTLCARHGIVLGPRALSRVVLVGGPTAMPFLRRRVEDALQAPFGEGLDPMTIVARGAALYAASSGLDARPSTVAAPVTGGVQIWLQYPAMSADTAPFLVGKLVSPADRAEVESIVVRRKDGSWSSAPEPLDADGTFATMLSLVARTRTELVVEGRSRTGAPVALSPADFAIVHGVTALDPPLSRSIGIALASDGVHRYFERGSPLPTRRTFTLRTVSRLSPDDPENALRVPIVQGELPSARLCRLVGTLEVPARALAAPVPAGTAIEVTIELDRGGRLAASARIPGTPEAFDRVAQLVAGTVPVEALGARLDELTARLQALRATAQREGQRSVLATLATADLVIGPARRDVDAARGGDLDAAEKARRALEAADALLASADAERAWPMLDERMQTRIAWATSWLGPYGTEDERRALATAVRTLEKARVAESAVEITRQLAVVTRLGHAAYLRSPGAYEHELYAAGERLGEASDPRRATVAFDEGRAANARGDQPALEKAVRTLWELLPAQVAEEGASHGSGVR